MGRAILLVASVLGAGCGGTQSAAPPDLGPLDSTLTLGGSDSAGGTFEPLVDGQDAQLVPGAQGGFHVWMKYRVAGMPAGGYRVARKAHRVDDGETVLRLLPDAVQIGAPGDGGTWESPQALPMFMCPSPIGVRVVDERIEYEIDILDGGGATVATGHVSLVPRCPSDAPDTQAFCEKICSG